MATVPDLYGVLGVQPDAGEAEIRRAYRKLARELHPDINKDPQAERQFKQVNAAYETLKDPVRRRQYDLFGTSGAPSSDLFPFGDVGDLFDAFFGGGFGGRRSHPRRRTRTERGNDLFAPLTLSFDEAVFGTTQEVAVDSLVECDRCGGTGCEPGTHPSRCAQCGGSGEIQDVARSIFGTVMTARPCTVCEGTGQEIASPCKTCKGEGRLPKKESFTVEVPGGVADGMELRVAGGGQEGRHGGRAGDLYVSLRVKPHPVFERRGQDLVCALSVSMTQAALGADIEIPTLDGDPERIRVEPGTQSGTVLRLRGRGIPHIGRRVRGDMFVTIKVEVPDRLSKEERGLLERLAQIRGEVPKQGEGHQARLGKLGDK